MKRRLAMVGFGRSVEAIDLLSGNPLKKKTTYRRYEKCLRQNPEILLVEEDDTEEAPKMTPGENHDH